MHQAIGGTIEIRIAPQELRAATTRPVGNLPARTWV